jgi:poly(hydroxyalkanoate) depolymerase family esterase
VLTKQPGRDTPHRGKLAEILHFGSNPGRLRMHVYAPPKLAPMGAPLIVLLHGCHQEAAAFAAASGWLAWADRLGSALVLPEQPPSNHQGRCFHWFRPMDVQRGQGESASIHAMIETALRLFRADPGRVFIVGLSAGGAMATNLLAAYPNLFAAGAVIAGLPAGAAHSFAHGIARMAEAGPPPGSSWADAARALAPPGYSGPWPRISIWHGTADTVVDPANAENLIAQWTGLHNLEPDSGIRLPSPPHVVHRIWGRGKLPLVEAWSILGMGHGFPVNGKTRAPFMLHVGLDATEAIANFFGLAEARGFLRPLKALGLLSDGPPLAPELAALKSL